MRRLILSRQASKNIITECRQYPSVETGGVLLGASNGDDIIVRFAIGSGPAAYRSASRFAPDVNWQQKRLDYYFEKYGTNYVGSYHRHPGKLARPSWTDYHTGVRILFDPFWSVKEIVFPIVLFENNHIVIYPYYLSRKTPDFEIIPLGILPDDHPLFNSASDRRGT